jgi:hypothetical protein
LLRPANASVRSAEIRRTGQRSRSFTGLHNVFPEPRGPPRGKHGYTLPNLARARSHNSTRSSRQAERYSAPDRPSGLQKWSGEMSPSATVAYQGGVRHVGCIWVLPVLGKFDQPFRLRLQIPDHRPQLTCLGSPIPVGRTRCPESLQSLWGPGASAAAAMHSTTPVRHRSRFTCATASGLRPTAGRVLCCGHPVPPDRQCTFGVFGLV